MITHRCKHCLEELLQVSTRQQSLFDILQQLKLSTVTPEEEKSLPQGREHRDRMLKQQNGHHH